MRYAAVLLVVPAAAVAAPTISTFDGQQADDRRFALWAGVGGDEELSRSPLAQLGFVLRANRWLEIAADAQGSPVSSRSCLVAARAPGGSAFDSCSAEGPDGAAAFEPRVRIFGAEWSLATVIGGLRLQLTSAPLAILEPQVTFVLRERVLRFSFWAGAQARFSLGSGVAATALGPGLGAAVGGSIAARFPVGRWALEPFAAFGTEESCASDADVFFCRTITSGQVGIAVLR